MTTADIIAQTIAAAVVVGAFCVIFVGMTLELRDSVRVARFAPQQSNDRADTRRAVRAARIAKLASIGRDENGALLRREV